MPTEVISKDKVHDRVTVLTTDGVEITFGHVRGCVHSVARSPSRYIQPANFDEALRLAKQAFREMAN